MQGSRPGKGSAAVLPVALVIGVTFAARWAFSARNSYWLDELYSVVRYGISNHSAGAMVERLARESIHPPLYQLVLFYWMRVFGDAEITTRFLSNLYVAGATLCLYLTVRDAMGQRRALVASLVLSLLNTPFYYAMETRSYAQTLLLSSASTLLVLRFERSSREVRGFGELVRRPTTIALVGVGFALLMTHYFNAFFFAAQGMFVLGLAALHARRQAGPRPPGMLTRLARVAAVLASPLLLLLLIWWPSMARSYRRRDTEYLAGAAVTDPFTAFVEHGLRPNLPLPWLVLLGLAVLIALSFAESARRARHSRRADLRPREVLAWYSLFMAFAPFLLVYMAFTWSGHERSSPRYYIYIAPSLAILLVLALERAVLAANGLATRRGLLRSYVARPAPWALTLILLVLPGTYAAAARDKADWRGVAQRVADVTREDPKHRYLLYATTFREGTELDYYLERSGAKIRAKGFLRPKEERRGRFKFEKDRGRIARHDYLIVAFTNHTVTEFGRAVAKLDATYRRHLTLIEDDRGVIVYRVNRRRRRSRLLPARARRRSRDLPHSRRP